MQAKVALDNMFIRQPIIPVVLMVIASRMETTTEIIKALRGPRVKPEIAIMASFGSYLRKSLKYMGRKCPIRVKTYAIEDSIAMVVILLVLFIVPLLKNARNKHLGRYKKAVKQAILLPFRL